MASRCLLFILLFCFICQLPLSYPRISMLLSVPMHFVSSRKCTLHEEPQHYRYHYCIQLYYLWCYPDFSEPVPVLDQC